MRHFTIEIDWHVWALPLCVMCHFGQRIIRVGPICILWWDRDMSDFGSSEVDWGADVGKEIVN